MIFMDNGQSIINNNLLLENDVCPICEFSFTDTINSINKIINRFLKLIKDAINTAIDFIDNNVFTKNKFYFKNKDQIINSLSNKSFNGYLFNIHQKNGAIDNLKTACSPKVTNLVSQYAENSSENFGDYLRGILNGSNYPCDQNDFFEKSKMFIYGSQYKSTHMTSEIYGGVDGMIDRMLDKRKNIRELKDLYYSFEKLNININDSRKIDTGSDYLNEYNAKCIEYSNIHMTICHQYLQIIISAIKDEYQQSNELCLSVFQ